MSKFDLRDISQRLASSKDSEAVVFEFLGYLQAVRQDWRAALAFYEVSRDALVNVYTRQGDRLTRRDLTLSLDRLPPRLVRKFFSPSANSNGAAKRSLLSSLFKASPYYEPDPLERPALEALMPGMDSASCVCLPLADQEDLIAMLVLTAGRKGAFGGNAMSEVVPLKNMAAVALAQHLYHAARRASADQVESARAAAEDFQAKIHRLHDETARRAEENRLKAGQVETLNQELEALDRHSSHYKAELDRVKQQLYALEEQSSVAADHLRETQIQVSTAVNRVADFKTTLGFMKEVFQVLGQEYDHNTFPRTIVTWFCEHFGIERCSLMVYDEAHETLRIGAYRGMDPEVAAAAQVRLGQGISGWVAAHRKPLFVRLKEEIEATTRTHQDVYNSDSFISVPMVFGNRLAGVLNFSNKSGGVPFSEVDLERASWVGSVLGMILGGRQNLRAKVAVPS